MTADRRRFPWASAAAIVGVALLARLVVVFATSPVLSDDVYRYVHDGHLIASQARSPYATPPAEHNPLDLPINNPELGSIYLPVSQAVFGAVAAVSPTERAFRVAFSAIDVVAVALLIAWLASRGASPWWAALYAWHPLAIAEVGNGGHQDAIGLPLLVAALWLGDQALRSASNPANRAAWSAIGCGVALALACLVKPIVLPAALFIAAAGVCAGGLRFAARSAGLAALGGLAVALPLLAWPIALDGGYGSFDATAQRFVTKWAANGSVHPLLESLTGTKAAADLLCAAGLVAVTAALAWAARPGRVVAATAAFFVAALLLSSTVHPWYLLWAMVLLPIAAARPTAATPAPCGLATVVVATTLAWSLVIPLAYTSIPRFAAGGPYQPYLAAVAAEYAVVYAALLISAAVAWVAARAARQKIRTMNDPIGSSDSRLPSPSTLN
ncbi:MAG: hypothetical protein AAF078_00655 [Planctomycetota bacterium]